LKTVPESKVNIPRQSRGLYGVSRSKWLERGDELKNARKASSWTQVQAAARLGVTQAYLSMVERESGPFPPTSPRALWGVFEVPATALPLAEYQTHR
jgi:DNA-binding XRE family transcriptional regulator